MPNGKGAKRVSVLELGAGKEPLGLIGQARRALIKRKGRKFEASDKETKKEVFRSFGLSKIPENAKILRQCSLKHLKKTKTASQDIIFGSYFLYSFGFEEARKKGIKIAFKKMEQIMKEIKRVLKKGGRAIFIIDLKGSEKVIDLAQRNGFKIHFTKFKFSPDKIYSKWIEERRTKEGRQDIIQANIRLGITNTNQLNQEVHEHGVKEKSDLLQPQVLIIRK
jgi:tRNA1(Val) A37 N6-methylase TrmN6